MNKEIVIVCIIVALIGIVVLVMHYQKDNFDISVEPVKSTEYEYLKDTSCPERPAFNYDNVEENGLNKEFNGRVTVKDYIDTYEQANDFNKPGTADIISRRYCDLLYVNHRRYFVNKWSGSGDCEIDVKKQVETMYPNTKTSNFDQ